MSKLQKPDIPEILFSKGDASQARQLRRMADAGKLVKVYAGVFTNNTILPLQAVVLRNWVDIVGHLLPGAVVSYRSAARAQPENGIVYVTRGRTRRTLELPGLTVEVIPGHGPVDQPNAKDSSFKKIYLASEARWLLENLSVGKQVGPRVLPQAELEQRLDRILMMRGERGLNVLRDAARQLANTLGMQAQFTRLDGLIGALLGSHPSSKLKSRQALARASGRPYDPVRVQLFDTLHAYLHGQVMPEVQNTASKGQAAAQFAFFEAYFSNYIEGTTFEIDEAEAICFRDAIIHNRTEDTHDIKGTFLAATTEPWRSSPPNDADEFLDWLRAVNAKVMAARLDKRPGEWKDKVNQAGSTVFVHPDLVPGTLREGYARIAALPHPFARALMTMFVIAETHPFIDGNGRTARLAMNCELCAGGLSRIIIPTVFREDYVLPLKGLSFNGDPVPYLRMMTHIQKWTAAFDYGAPLKDLTAALEGCNAFKEDVRAYKLLFPA